jgi:hypothetical protein
MKVAKRLARYGAIASDTSWPPLRLPMAVKHGPDPCSWGREVDLDELAGGVSAHHDMQEQSHADRPRKDIAARRPVKRP